MCLAAIGLKIGVLVALNRHLLQTRRDKNILQFAFVSSKYFDYRNDRSVNLMSLSAPIAEGSCFQISNTQKVSGVPSSFGLERASTRTKVDGELLPLQDESGLSSGIFYTFGFFMSL